MIRYRITFIHGTFTEMIGFDLLSIISGMSEYRRNQIKTIEKLN